MRRNLPSIDLANFQGIDTLRSPDQLESSPQATKLQNAHGLVPIERGRPRSCWEGTSAEATFDALIDGTSSIEEAPKRVIYWSGKDDLVAMNDYRMCLDGSSTLLVISQSGASEKEVWALDLGDHLLVCVDKEPARIYNKNLESPASDHFDSSSYRAEIKAPYAPIWLYRHWFGWDDGVKLNTSSYSGGRMTKMSATIAATMQGASGPHGSGLNMKTAGRDFTTTGFAYDKSAAAANNGLATQAMMLRSDNTDVEGVIGVDAGDVNLLRDDFPGKVGYNHEQHMLRFPELYKGRVAAVEGREYQYTRLLAGSGVVGSLTSGGSSMSLSSYDATSTVFAGDEVIIFESTGGTDSEIYDYIWSSENTTTHTVLTVDEVGGNTTITFTSTHGHGTGSVMWAARRPLTDEQRRTVYFGGHPANNAQGISQDVRDFTHFDTGNTVIVGEFGEGDITGLLAQGDDRLIVGLGSAIYEIVGNPPINGFNPPGFDARQITGDVGLYRDTAAAWDGSGQILYFCSGDGIHTLYGQRVDPVPVSAAIQNHPDYSSKFSHLVFDDVNSLLYCKTDADDPAIFIYDTISREWFSGKRINSGQDQTGTLAALELSDGSYASNKIYESGDHGGLFNPYRNTSSEDTRILVAYKDTDYKLRTLNYLGDEHNQANLLWGGKIVTGMLQGDNVDTFKLRRIVHKNTLPMLDSSGGSAFEEQQFSITGSEGAISLSRDINPKVSTADFDQYECNGTGGRAESGIEITIGDEISPLGQLAGIRAYVVPRGDRG